MLGGSEGRKNVLAAATREMAINALGPPDTLAPKLLLDSVLLLASHSSPLPATYSEGCMESVVTDTGAVPAAQAAASRQITTTSVACSRTSRWIAVPAPGQFGVVLLLTMPELTPTVDPLLLAYDMLNGHVTL